jgi:hypothetical protein
MVTLKTHVKTKRCFANYHEPARVGRTIHARFARRVLLTLLSLSVLLAGAELARADEVTDWTHIMLEATLTPPETPAPITTRSAAIVQAAIFDAVNGIDPHYTPIFVRRTGPRHASRRAAAVEAAYAILIRLYPAQSETLDQQRSASLTRISRGWGAEHSESIQKGVEWGQLVADAIWAWRSNDGSQTYLRLSPAGPRRASGGRLRPPTYPGLFRNSRI